MNTTRIPALEGIKPAQVSAWMAAMSKLGLAFHPEDDPETIFSGPGEGVRTFSDEEVSILTGIIDKIYDAGFDPCEVWLDTDRMTELRAEQGFEREGGPNAWAAKNPEEARELEELEEKYADQAD